MKRPILLLAIELGIAVPLLIAYARPSGAREVILNPPPEMPVFTFGDEASGKGPAGLRAPNALTVDVAVGSAGNIFSPATANIVAGDTVRWTWSGSNHTVTSGVPCTVDNLYCSLTNTNCSTAATSNSGTVYSHIFNTAGTFQYFCRVHCGGGMRGTVVVVAPFASISAVTRASNGHFVINGKSNANRTVTITSAPDLLSTFGNPQTANTDATGAFSYDDASAVGQAMRFYKVSYP